MHFLGIKWDNQSQSPFFVYREEPNKGEIQRVSIGTDSNFKITISGERYCTGSKDICPQNVALQDTSFAQCFACSKDNSTHFLSLAGLTHEQVQYLKEIPHFNYINIFGTDVLKTGVVTHLRKFSRVLEQGATATLFFTECDGYTARQIERYVSKNLSIKQAVGWEKKISLLKQKVNSDILQSKLLDLYTNVVKVLPVEYKGCLKQTPEYSFNLSKFEVSINQSLQKIVYIDTVSGGDVIGGRVIGTYGQILLLENNGEVYALNTKNVMGFIVRVEKSNVGKTVMQGKVKDIYFEESPTEVVSLF